MPLSPFTLARLYEVIESEVARVPAAELARAAERLSESYRGEREPKAPHLSSHTDRAAYLAIRMPATLAAVMRALELTREQLVGFSPQSVTDIGAGPGTATIAAQQVFDSLSTATLIERDTDLLAVARRLLAKSDLRSRAADLLSAEIDSADVVLCSYALNELVPDLRMKVVQRAWSASKRLLVLIEPGSRAGFGNILAARDYFLTQADAQIAAPCPGHMPCSLAVIGDWCHFSARVQRSSIHRRLKHAALSYEDEKFSFLAVARASASASSAEARIVRRPEKRTGHVKLDLCTPDLLQHVIVTKKHGPLYKIARHSEWGDAFTYPLAQKEEGSR